MKDQHTKIKGYRDLSQEEVDLMNRIKDLASKCGELVSELEYTTGLDQRSIALGKTNLQQGFMWAVRGVAQPKGF